MNILLNSKVLPFSIRSGVANRIVISSLTKFFVKQEPVIDQMVSKIINFLKLQPNFTASYQHTKTECGISSAKTFKLPLLKKFCDTNLVCLIKLILLLKL